MNVTGMITPPLFIHEGGDLMIFETIDDAVRYIEPVDVIEGVYVGYDSQGMLLKFKAQSQRYDQPIEIVSAETEPTHQEELRDVLITYLRALGISEPSISQASLDALEIKAKTFKQAKPSERHHCWWLRLLIRK